MKKTYTVLLLICTIINVYLALPLIAEWLSHLVSIDWVVKSGPLGDTFGGLLSPIIGLISFYFIYRTFKLQRKQLADQKKANSNSLGALYLSELKDLLEDVSQEVIKLDYVDAERKSHKGKDALKAFLSDSYASEVYKQYENEREGKFLSDMNTIILQVLFVGSQIDAINEDVKPQYLNFLKNRMRVVLRIFLNDFEKIFDQIRKELKNVSSEEKSNHGNTIGWLSYYLKQYTDNLKKLSEMGFVVVKSRGDASSQKNYSTSINVEEFKDFNFDEYFILPTLPF